MTSLDETQIADLVAMVAARTSVPDPSELRLRVARRQRLRRAAFAGSIFVALLIASTAVFGGSAEEEVELADVGSPPAAGETGSPEINPLSDCAGVLEASGDWTDEMLALCERLFGSNARSTAAVISEAQSELLNDLSFAGYETAFANFRSCLQRGGVALQITSEPTRERPLWTYQFPDTQGASLIHDACYEWHFELVDSSWQATLAANTIPDGLAVSCAGIVGAAPGVDSRALRLCNRTIARVYGLEGANAGDLLLKAFTLTLDAHQRRHVDALDGDQRVAPPCGRIFVNILAVDAKPQAADATPEGNRLSPALLAVVRIGVSLQPVCGFLVASQRVGLLGQHVDEQLEAMVWLDVDFVGDCVAAMACICIMFYTALKTLFADNVSTRQKLRVNKLQKTQRTFQ